MRIRTATTLALAATGALLLTGCDSGSTPDKPTKTAVQTATATPTPVADPYMEGYQHGETQQNNPDFQTNGCSSVEEAYDRAAGKPESEICKSDAFQVGFTIGTHCGKWAKNSYPDTTSEAYNEYTKGCTDAIHRDPPNRKN